MIINTIVIQHRLKSFKVCFPISITLISKNIKEKNYNVTVLVCKLEFWAFSLSNRDEVLYEWLWVIVEQSSFLKKVYMLHYLFLATTTTTTTTTITTTTTTTLSYLKFIYYSLLTLIHLLIETTKRTEMLPDTSLWF